MIVNFIIYLIVFSSGTCETEIESFLRIDAIKLRTNLHEM